MTFIKTIYLNKRSQPVIFGDIQFPNVFRWDPNYHSPMLDAFHLPNGAWISLSPDELRIYATTHPSKRQGLHKVYRDDGDINHFDL